MKTKTHLILALITGIYSHSIYSQDINLTYSDGSTTLPLDNTQSMTIDSTNGNINIATSSTAEQIGLGLGLEPVGDSPNIQFGVTANGTTSATINAVITNDAVYCQKSGLWTGLTTSTPPNNYVTSVSQTVSSNGSNYVLSCSNSFGITSLSTSVTNIVSVVAPVITINATATSVNNGGSSTITWSVANSPTSCDFTGDWPVGTNLADGPFSFLEQNITSSKSYSVTCQNSAGSDTESISVSIIGGDTWTSCSGAGASILNGAEDRTILSNGSSPLPYNGLYETLQGNDVVSQWPGIWGDALHMTLEKNKYVAAKFTTDSNGYDAKFQMTASNSIEGPNPQAKAVTISTCPGDFNVHLNQVKCYTETNSLYWSTKDVPGQPGFFCELEKNTTYYLNIVHSNNNEGNNFATSDCLSPANYCGILAAQNEVTF